ncbi:MAG TPA: hypothetical protein PJ991_04925 [Kiritimatiellia bacterium]|nr:hypothetical protein [Kiritimatiellia bacterium]
MKMKAIVVLCLMMACHHAGARAITNAVTNATLSTTSGASIRDTNLVQWINQYIPTNSKKLVVNTQCYGGDMARAFGDDPNTAVISGTSPGQLGIYGGYDDGASRGLRPGAGRTAQDVHTAGIGTRNQRETPTVGGGLSPTNFPMEPVSTGGVVRSRHVIFYAGQPDDRPGRDVDQDARIAGNFAGEPNTTYEAVAGTTAGGWDQNGNAAGLRRAIQNAGAAITNSPTPDQEQFILYITDHGDLHVTAVVTTNIPPFGPPVTFSNFPAFTTNTLRPEGILRDAHAIPGFSVFVPFPEGGDVLHIVNEPYTPFFPSGWQMIVTPEIPAALPIILNEFFELPFELDNNVVGDFPDEGIVLFFPVDKHFFVDSFFDVFLTIDIIQTTGQPWPVEWISQDSGSIAKPGSPMIEVFELVPDNPTGPFLIGWGGYDPVRLEFSHGLDPQGWIPMTPFMPGGPQYVQFFDIPFPVGMIRAFENSGDSDGDGPDMPP